MRKFFVYCTVLIGLLFVGMMTYYLLRNNEVINITHAESEPIHMNKGETRELPFERVNPHRDTTMEIYTLQPNLLKIDTENNTMEALKGGTATLIINSSNSSFTNYNFTVIIGDGSASNPWLLTRRGELLQIGLEGSAYTMNSDYILASDVDLRGEEWIPIGTVFEEDGETVHDQIPFTGKFTTGGLTRVISNLKITERSYDYAGLFAKLGPTALVEDIRISGVTISSSNKYVGAVAGLNQGSIFRVEVFTDTEETDGGISSSLADANVGGIVGANMVGTINPANGLVESAPNGLERAKMEMVGFEGKLTAETAGCNIGGITGYMAGGRLFNTYAKVNFTITEDINYGALVGFANSAYLMFSPEVAAQRPDSASSKRVFPLIRDSYAVMEGTSAFLNSSVNYGIIGKMDYSEAIGEIGSERNLMAGIYFCTPSGDFQNEERFRTFTTPRLVVRINNAADLQGAEKISWATIPEADQVFVTVIGTSRTPWSIGLPNNLDKVWRIDTDRYPYFNFNGRADDLDIDEDAFYITNLADLRKYQNLINTSGPDGKMNPYWADQSYVVTADNIDLGGTEWVPLGSDSVPFTGKFRAQNGKNPIIRNFQITAVTAERVCNGFFAVLDNFAVVENINFADVIISNGVYVGVVAGFNSGLISNVSVNNVSLSVKDNLGISTYNDVAAGAISADLLNARFVGFITGYNDGLTGRGTITASPIGEGANITYKEMLGAAGGKIYVNAADKTTYAGGVAGMNNTGKITNIKIKNKFEINAVKINEEIEVPVENGQNQVVSGGVYRFLGGITGRNAGGMGDMDQPNLQLPDGTLTNLNGRGQIINCAVEGSAASSGKITDLSLGHVFIGGITALNQKGGVIEQSHAGGNTELVLAATQNRADQKEIGGIAGVNYGVMTRSFANVSMVGVDEFGLYYAGGIAAINFKGGYISECYARGHAEGSILGGITVINQGEVEHCYTTLSMKGTKNDSVMAGLSTYIPEGGTLKFCLVMASYSGTGTIHAETASNFKGNILTIASQKLFGTSRYNLLQVKVGYIESIIIDKDLATPNAIKQDSAGFGDLWGAVQAQNGRYVYYLTTDEMTSDNPARIILSPRDGGADFGSHMTIWSYGVEGQYLILRNIGTDDTGTLDGIVQYPA